MKHSGQHGLDWIETCTQFSPEVAQSNPVGSVANVKACNCRTKTDRGSATQCAATRGGDPDAAGVDYSHQPGEMIRALQFAACS